jgi:hypothetical protein
MPPQMKGEQARTAPVAHVPVPSQRETARSVAAMHIAGAQLVPATNLRQAPAPSHVPSVPQVVAPLSAHWPSGSWPVGTIEQMPCVPARPHDRQMPLHSVLQQVPCSQMPELHSAAVVQAPPSGFLPQLVAMQVLGAVHSSSFEHTVWQAPFAPQMNGAHDCVTGVGHLPSASQRDASVIVDPAHDAGEQVEPTGYLRQAPAPSHTPSRPQVSTPSSAHWSRGSVPTSAATHVPTLFCAAQVMQVPAHSELQQTPSVQNPLAHSSPAVHGAPSTRRDRASSPFVLGGVSPPPASGVYGASAVALASRRIDSPSGPLQAPAKSATPTTM